VISFASDGAPEVCVPDETGLLVEPRNVTQLAEAMIRLAQDAALRQRLGTTGRDRFTEQFRHQNMTRQIRDVYAQVLEASDSRHRRPVDGVRNQ